MSIFTRLFSKPKVARASFGGQRAQISRTITGDPARLAARRARLRKSLSRAEGERKASLEREIAAINAQLEAVRSALEE